MAKESFIVYHSILEQTQLLTDEQMGQLFRSMITYSMGGEPPISDPIVAVSFSFVKPTMDKDKAKWEDIIRKRSESGKKGGRPRKTQQTQPEAEPIFLPEKQMLSEKTVKCQVSSESVNVNVPVTVQSLESRPADEPTETCDRDGCERDFQDVLAYAKRSGFTFSAKQRKRLRNFVNRTSFEYVISAIDRAVFHQGRTATYVLRILDEWWGEGLTTTDKLNAYLERKEGGESA